MEPAQSSQAVKAITIKKLFSRETSVSINILAAPDVVWKLLTNAADIARWNSTVISITGQIMPGGEIELKSTRDEKKGFQIKNNGI